MRRLIGFVLMAVFSVGFLAACTEPEASKDVDQNREDAVIVRERNFDRAEKMHPAPTDLVNFPIREALVNYTKRQDLVNHPWYIYVMGMDGTPVGYYVGKTYPVNSCNFLSSTERFVDLPDAQWGQVTSPSYDGIFYGGGGASGNCSPYFFFDTVTDAMHTFVAPMWFASDKPLNIDVPQLGTEGQLPPPPKTDP
jgi:hypothetical protein